MLATDAIAWDALKALPVRYSEWEGNRSEAGADAEIVTDGHMAWLAEHADSDRNERLAGKQHKITYPASSETVGDMWRGVVRNREQKADQLAELHLVELRELPRQDLQLAKLEGLEEPTYVNAQYLRILQLVTDFDRIEGFSPTRALYLLRDGDVVALLMSRRGTYWADGEPLELD